MNLSLNPLLGPGTWIRIRVTNRGSSFSLFQFFEIENKNRETEHFQHVPTVADPRLNLVPDHFSAAQNCEM